MSMHFVDDEQHSDHRASPMRPSGSGVAGASASLALLDDVHRHRLRRAALHLPPRRQERGLSYYSDRLLGFRIWILLPVFLVPLLMHAGGKGDAARGKTLFSRCAICHGASGEGNEAIGKAYGVKMPVLGSKEVQSLDDAAVKKVIGEGKGKMQPVKLSDTEVDDVIAFVRSLKNPSPK